MIKESIEKIISNNSLSLNEAYSTMVDIMEGKVNNSHIASFLTALKMKGETPEEIAGFVMAMREKSIKINCEDDNIIDVCGTGGDNSNTFNISTAASFVVAAAGIKVAKHGNRSISSKSGSADVLKELGININLSAELCQKQLSEIGITFLFAPNFHPAMKFAAPVRNELGFKTVFNILGPLTNPAGTKKQLIGTFSNRTSELMLKASNYLDMQKVCFICTNDQFDEISLTDETNIYELNAGSENKNYSITPDSFSYPKISLSSIQGGTSVDNAKIIYNALKEKVKNEAFFVISANAAFGIYSSGVCMNLEDCKLMAEEAILSGKAFDKLLQVINFSDK